MKNNQQPSMEALPSPLSSRPERSGVEGPAVLSKLLAAIRKETKGNKQ
jgi:hypothetical protein